MPRNSRCRVGADHQRDPAGADVRAFDDDVAHRQLRPVIVEVADPEPAPDQRPAGVDQRLRVHETQLQRLADGEDLEHRAELVDALHRPVEQRAVGLIAAGQRPRPVVGVEVGQRGHREDLAGVDLHQDGRGAHRVHHRHAARQHLLHRRLDGEVDRQLQRLALVGRVAQPGVEIALDPGDADHLGRVDALAAVARAAEDVRGDRPVGIKPHLPRAEQQAGLADVVHLLHLLGADLAPDPEEPAAAGEVGQKLGLVELGEDPRELAARRRPGRPSAAAGHRARGFRGWWPGPGRCGRRCPSAGR